MQVRIVDYIMHNIRTNNLLVLPSKHTNTVLFYSLTLHCFSHLSAVALFLYLVLNTAEPWCYEEEPRVAIQCRLAVTQFSCQLKSYIYYGYIWRQTWKKQLIISTVSVHNFSRDRNCFGVEIISMLYRWKQLWPSTHNLKSAQYAMLAREPWTPTKHGVSKIVFIGKAIYHQT